MEALPSVLVLLLYIFRRLPTRFSFHALRLAASREQKGERGKREKTKRKRKQMKKGEKKKVKAAHDVASELSARSGWVPWSSLARALQLPHSQQRNSGRPEVDQGHQVRISHQRSTHAQKPTSPCWVSHVVWPLKTAQKLASALRNDDAV